MIKVLMAGVDRSTKGGMWSVAENYLKDEALRRQIRLTYIPTASSGSKVKRLACFIGGTARILANLIFARPDVVHLHVSERGSVRRKALIARMARSFGCRVALHMHGAEFQTWYESLDEKGRQRVRDFLSGADRVLILGEYWRGFIGGLTDAPEKLRVLYNAVPVPAENKFDPGAAQLLFLGEVGQRKGAYDLLQAMQRIDAQLPPETQLILYGPNPDGDIQARIDALQLGSRVRYGGWADQQTKDAAFAKTAVNILPSYHEGLPMTLLEAMARGIPCITTPVAAIPEAVDDANGVLLPPGDVPALADAVLRLVQEPEARRAKSHSAYQRMKERFSMESHRTALMQIYQEMTEMRK